MEFRYVDIETEFFIPKDYRNILLDQALVENIIVPIGPSAPKDYLCLMLIREMSAQTHYSLCKNGKRSAIVVPQDNRPRILGLTLSFSFDSVEPDELMSAFTVLEQRLHCKIAAANPILVPRKLGAKPRLLVKVCQNDENIEWAPFASLVRYLVLGAVEWTKRLSLSSDLDVDCTKCMVEALCKVVDVLDQLGPWCAWKVCIKQERQLIKLNKYCMSEAQQALILMGETYLKAARMLLDSHVKGVKSVEGLQRFVTGRAWELLQWLVEYGKGDHQSSENDKLCGIILVRKRYIAYVLKMLLKTVQEWNSDMFGYFTTDFFAIFREYRSKDSAQLAQYKRQEDVLRKFRHGNLNVLVATCASWDSLETKRCNFVIRFDHPTSYCSFAHSKALAKKPDASFVILLQSKDQEAFEKTLKKYLAFETILLKRTAAVDLLDENNCKSSELNNLTQLASLVGGTQLNDLSVPLNLNTATEIVNRYCVRLPSDMFTRLVPEFTLETIENADMSKSYVGHILLPINSPLKERITGPPMHSRRSAQLAVALEVCRKLHKHGEVNDQFQPIGRSVLSRILIDCEDDEVWPTDGKALPGSSRRKQHYRKKIPKVLFHALPEPDKPSFLYAIVFHKIRSDTSIGCQTSFDGLNVRSQTLGILTSESLPQIPKFCLFPKAGATMVEIRFIDKSVTVNSGQLFLIFQFHEYMFSEVLRLEKFSIKYDPRQADTSFLVVPLVKDGTSNYTLDWAFIIETIKFTSQLPLRPAEEERKLFKFCIEKYIDAVVMPWYRVSGGAHFYNVIDICTDLTPASTFPDDEYSSFNEYYRHKYGLEIYCQDQALLNVDYSTSRLNLLLPRNAKERDNSTDSTESQQAVNIVAQKQKLIPELVVVHPISSSMWALLICLPSILYRLCHLLLADELRARVMRERFSVGPTIPADFCWEPMDVTWLHNASRCAETAPSPPKGSEVENCANQTVKSTVIDKLDFEISVWNPEEAQVPENCDNDPSEVNEESATSPAVAANGLTAEEVELAAEDVASDDEEIYFDDEFRKKLMQTQQVSSSELERLFLPPPGCIEPSGWDSADLPTLPSFTVGGGPGLQFLSTASHVNASSLLADIKNTEMKSKTSAWNVQRKASCNSSKEAPAVDSTPNSIAKISKAGSAEDLHDSESLSPDCVIDIVALVRRTKFQSATDSSLPETAAVDVLVGNTVNDESGVSSSFTEAPELPLNETISFIDDDDDKSGPFGPNPRDILEALTASSAHDVFSLEGLEILGDSFLKYLVTVYYFKQYPNMHEGNLSVLRGRQVSNYNLYKLGRRKGIGEFMVGCKFEPADNWLPPGYMPLCCETAESYGDDEDNKMERELMGDLEVEPLNVSLVPVSKNWISEELKDIIPDNLFTKQALSDKSIADCVEALIGSFLLTCGTKKAIGFIEWLGVKVASENCDLTSPVQLPLIDSYPNAADELKRLWNTFDLSQFENKIGYRFQNKAYLVQALCHTSYSYNRCTDCYQRLEFLGDAVLDYLITRHLYEDKQAHSPNLLTDLRSSLVNNTIFSSLAVKFKFHQYFMVLNPTLCTKIEKFVTMLETLQQDANFDSELYLLEEEDEEAEEDVEVPKVLGDIFESVAGAIYLDSGCFLHAVWRVYYVIMHEQIKKCCANPPVSPVRKLMEMEPERTTFRRVERNMVEGNARVTAHVHGVGTFTGAGRCYRIAKTTAAKRALRFLKRLRDQANCSSM
ncbi:Dicer dimer and Helicase C and PAZ and Ribonuclea se 3 domain containing protein [Trichuris trichiura]|uniref:Dicer dimer and Helicase C and PAZ and Ribonuclea se 3 domain containing protein n=1 Tax=Trichuris trichiura TaxID=36087 RepID=A0A077Z5F4_TRITR|nr:Dicer dimer and Helicase C and PAZ and Ribonuclea se 3 domain containing protein [Trichuris trichiura]